MASRGGRGRRWRIAVVVATCVAGLAVLAWLNRPRDEPARATVDDAVRSFRAESDSKARADGPREPAPGVYRYATRGSESVQTPIIGATHDYDGISTIVLSAGPCGQHERWQVLAGRWTEGEVCDAKHGESSATLTEFHEFFETGQEDLFHCRNTSAPGTTIKAGERFSSHCESDDSSVSTASQIIGFEQIPVGNEVFDAAHVKSQSTLAGENVGTSIREEWWRRSDGLLLRRSAESEADTSAGGGSHYRERYTIQLLSTKPRR